MTNTAANLWRMLSLRDDYPAGECWAWMDSADRRCAKPADDSHLCARHTKAAQAKLDRLKAKAAPKANPERRAMLESRIASYSEQLESTAARLDALQAILDRIDAEEHAVRVAVFEQCDDCVSYDLQAMCDPEPHVVWDPCARHRKEGR